MKRQLKELIDQATHDENKNILDYEVLYRDKQNYLRIPLLDFLSPKTNWHGEATIPYHRIIKIFENKICIFERKDHLNDPN